MPLAQAAETSEMRKLMAESALDTDSNMSVTEGNKHLAKKKAIHPRHAKKSSSHSKKSSSSRKMHSLPSLGTDTAKSEVPNTTRNHEETDVQRWQGNFENLWGVMSSPDTNRATRDFATSQVTGMANRMAEDAVRDWLSHKGNARVSFSYPAKGSADVLIPAWDTKNHLIFGQAGVRLDRERNTWNAGLGWRYYPSKQWMLGVNSFYDYDHTGGNARWGAGVEARTDYLSLSANRYFRITDWHQSPLKNMEDYDERPANGYDLRGKFWLPSFPKIGGELAYEKYFGKNVSIKRDASPDSLHDAPYALTSSVNYTPFPLVTMSVGHKSGSISETIAKLQLNYQFGQPLSVQFDGENVKLMRSLAGSRYDFVDRNYNIVMQYRKQPMISLTLPASLTGQARSIVRVNATIWAKHGIKKVDWQSPDLQAAGGAITPGDSVTQAKVKLPKWKAGGNNTYRLTAVATDVKGNSTEQAETLLHVEESTANIYGNLTVDKESAPASGTDIVTYTASVTDAKGNPVEGQDVNWKTDLGKLSGSSSVTDKDGKATIQLTSTVMGIAKVSANTNEKPAANAPEVKFTADITSAHIASGDLKVDKKEVVANLDDMATYTARVTDMRGNILPDYTVRWSTDKGTLEATDSITDDKGYARVELRHTVAEKAVVTATVRETGKRAQTVQFIADEKTAEIEVKPVKTKITGTGVETTKLFAKVADAYGNPLDKYELTWKSSIGTIVGHGNTNVKGKTSATLTAPVIVASSNEDANVTATGKFGIVGDAIVIVRAVIDAGGKHYWTMYTDYPSADEGTAKRFCQIHGGGKLANLNDLKNFKDANADFANMSVSYTSGKEFGDWWYRLAGTWNSRVGDFSSEAGGPVGRDMAIITGAGVGGYVCVK